MSDTILMAIGCYTQPMPFVAGNGKGIHIVALDRQTGAMNSLHVVGGIRSPSYLAVSPAGDRLYAVEELDMSAKPQLHTYALDRTTGALELLGKVSMPGSSACHVSIDPERRFAFVSNFSSGDLLCYRLSVEGLPEEGPQVLTRPGNGSARVHCAVAAPEGDLLLVCDAGNDTIAAYALSEDGVDPRPVTELRAAPGAFTRHVALSPEHSTFLAVHELASSLSIGRLTGNRLSYGETLSGLPEDWKGENTGAAVRIHPNGRFGYMSNRGHDSIFGAAIDHEAMTLTPLGNWPAGGRNPRDFSFDPSGRWLVAAHQNGDTLASFSVNPETGELTSTGHTVDSGSPVSVLFL